MSRKSDRNWQLRRIHQLRAALGMDRETYVEMLAGTYGVSSSTELDDTKRAELIGRLTEQAVKAGVWNDWQPTPVKRASEQAIRRLRYHSLFCAVHRAPLPAFVMDDGTTREGEQLRRYIIERFNEVRDHPQREGVAQIPESILRHLSNEFINPLCNKWLGELTDEPRSGNTLYLHELSATLVQQLTVRWKQFQAVIEAGDPNVNVPFTTTVPTHQEKN